MKVIVSSQALTPWYGGSAISEASLCASLAKEIEVTVLCRKGALDYSFVHSFNVKEVREVAPAEVFDAWKHDSHWLSRLFDEADVFHLNGHWKWESYFFARLCVRKKIPYVLHPRGMLLVGHRRVALKRAFNLAIGKWIVRHAAKVIALSHFELKQFAPYHIPAGRIGVLPNGISIPTLAGGTEFPQGVVRYENPFFLYLGRLERRKNLLFLIDVFSSYVKGGGSASLFLVGPVERDYDREIEAKTKALGLTEKVKMLPPLYGQEKWAYMAQAEAVVYPSYDEPFGRVPFEAILAGAYPIVPDESGSAEYLRAYLGDCIYHHQNGQSLLETMKAVEEKHHKGDVADLSRAQAWVRDTLSWDRVAGEVIRIYEEITGQKRLDHKTDLTGAGNRAGAR